ncbi:MAG: hypothetical protein A2081_06215 [Elusimicrobia bacterium GWC2_61_19]|nr:MAG: hypothetical protein A2081_06215 [Elusimicrobia bacterium GWC2_61_19]
MKIFILLLLAAGPLSAEWGPAENSAAAALAGARVETSVISAVPLPDLLAARDLASRPLTIGGVKFLSTVVFDAAWDSWFVLKPAGGGLGAGAWKETDLAGGAVYNHGGLELRLQETDGVVTVQAPGGEKAEVSINGLFDLLYAESLKIKFGDAVTYAMFRNLAPLSEEEGTAALRIGSDGLYYYSVTPDSKIEAEPRWLLAINWVLYGLRIKDGSLLFVSKPIEMAPEDHAAERARPR